MHRVGTLLAVVTRWSHGRSQLSRQLTTISRMEGERTPMSTSDIHAVSGNRMTPPFPGNTEEAVLGMGCFWGAEKLYWQTAGVYCTHVGYCNGTNPHPTYKEICTGETGHAEVIRVIYHPEKITYSQILKMFWETHDPTQGMRQGFDVGSQYRSAIFYATDAQRTIAEQSKVQYERRLIGEGHGAITTQIEAARTFYYAEDYHQQYLHKNPARACAIGGTGVTCPLTYTTTQNDK